MEDPSTPTFLGLCPAEWHAVTFGLKSGLKVWKRQHTAYTDIDKLDISPELKTDLKAKYHYLTFCEDLPEDAILLGMLGYVVVTGQAEGAARIAMSVFGVTL